MSYIIYNNDGTILANIANGDIDNVSTSLDLIGKNVDNYGQYFNNNLVKLLTSFASDTKPISAQAGQLWFNTVKKKLNVFDGTDFNPTYGATVSGTAAVSTSTGDLWYDTRNNQLKIWDGYTYKLIGPSESSIYGKFGISVSTATTLIRDYESSIQQKVGLMYSYGTVAGLITTNDFTMKAADAAIYFNTSTTSTVVTGLTLPNNLDIKKNLYMNGVRQLPPVQTLTAYFNITSYGDPQDATRATAILNIAAGNIAISSHLALLFSTSTNATYNEVAYPIGSDAKVVCYYNSTPSVRRFHLIEDPLHPGNNMWHWWDLYYSSSLSTVTNIVVH